MRRTIAAVVAAAAYVAAIVSGTARPAAESAFTWNLPRGFPAPRVPAGNAMTPEKVDLGRHLFYDARLSANRQQSCASCHEQARAFTDGRERAVGSTGEVHPRNSMSLVNVGYAGVLTWGNPSLTRLEDQALVPMFGDHPIELGLARPGTALLERLREDARYRAMFAAAFPAEAAPFTIDNVTRALASFERSIISARSPYDRYHTDRVQDAISPAARRGEILFFSQPFSCFRCHHGFMMAGATDFEGRQPRAEGGVEFHNTGLYNLAGALSYPPPNTGVYEITQKAEDVGRFKAPTLRNISVTGPYMHDGSIATLDGVLDHYAAGGRTIADGPHRGIGHDNPNKSRTVRGFTLTPGQRADFIAFLNALTDEELLRDPRFSNPWTAPGR
jgi:cytochrome c peroxidase